MRDAAAAAFKDSRKGHRQDSMSVPDKQGDYGDGGQPVRKVHKVCKVGENQF